MIDPSSSEEESDDEQRETPITQSHHPPRGHLHTEPQRESLDIPNKAGSHRSLSPNSTTSSDTLNVGQSGGMGSSSGASNISSGGTPLRGAMFQRPTSPSPSLVSEKTVTDSIDPQVGLTLTALTNRSSFHAWFVVHVIKAIKMTLLPLG